MIKISTEYGENENLDICSVYLLVPFSKGRFFHAQFEVNLEVILEIPKVNMLYVAPWHNQQVNLHT